MLKKGIYIFTAFCLFNTMFCFYAGNFPRGSNGDPALAEADSYAGAGTLLNFLFQQFQDDGDSDGGTPLGIKSRHNCFLLRSTALSIQAPIQAISGLVFFPRPVLVPHANYLICKASLPSYYNFLFRLNPF